MFPSRVSTYDMMISQPSGCVNQRSSSKRDCLHWFTPLFTADCGSTESTTWILFCLQKKKGRMPSIACLTLRRGSNHANVAVLIKVIRCVCIPSLSMVITIIGNDIIGTRAIWTHTDRTYSLMANIIIMVMIVTSARSTTKLAEPNHGYWPTFMHFVVVVVFCFQGLANAICFASLPSTNPPTFDNETNFEFSPTIVVGRLAHVDLRVGATGLAYG